MNRLAGERKTILWSALPTENGGRGQRFLFFSLPVILTCLLLMTHLYLFAPLVGIGLIFFMILFWNPVLAYYGIILLIPFAAYRTLFGNLKLHWFFGAFLLLHIALKTLISKKIPGQLENNLIWPWLGVYLLLSFMATLASPFPVTAWNTLNLLVVALVFIGLCQIMIDRRAFSLHLPRILIGSVSLGSLLSLIGYVFHINLFANDAFIGGLTRGIGGSLDPNNMSLMIIFIMPLLVHEMIQACSIQGKLLTAGFMLLNLAGLIVTYSRGGLLIFGLALFLISIEYGHYLRPHYLGLFLLTITGVLIATWIMVPQTYWQRQKTLAAGGDSSLQRRTSYLVVGLGAVKQHPLLGQGPGTFREIYGDSPVAAAFERGHDSRTRKRFAHNTYLEILVGTGVTGLAAFLLVLGATFTCFTKAKRQFLVQGEPQLAQVTASYRIAFLSICAYLFIFSDLFHKYLLLSIGLAQVACFLSHRDQKEKK